MVLLGLHGAMVADGYDDCEGDLLQRVRAMVGPKSVVGAELDPHNHLTPAMLDNADLLIAFKEYPHTDVLERALELVDLCAATVEGSVKPVAAVVDCEMIVTMHTSRDPARALRRPDPGARRQGRHPVDLGLARLRLGRRAGDGHQGAGLCRRRRRRRRSAGAPARRRADRACATALARALPGIDAALDEALAFDGGPVVLADGADNPGGGAAGDSTFVLRRMLERGIANACLGPIWDPVAVRIAFEAGVGATPAAAHRRQDRPAVGRPDRPARCTVKALHAGHGA